MHRRTATDDSPLGRDESNGYADSPLSDVIARKAQAGKGSNASSRPRSLLDPRSRRTISQSGSRSGDYGLASVRGVHGVSVPVAAASRRREVAVGLSAVDAAITPAPIRRNTTSMTEAELDRVATELRHASHGSFVSGTGASTAKGRAPLVSGVGIDANGFSCSPARSERRKQQSRSEPSIQEFSKIRSVADQEFVLSRDIIAIMLGGEGAYIDTRECDSQHVFPDTAMAFEIPFAESNLGGASSVAAPTKLEERLRYVEYEIYPSFHATVRDTAYRILPIARAHTLIRSFIDIRSKYEYGLVNHALCAAMRDTLREYQHMVVKLSRATRQDSTFTLSKMYVYVSRPLPVMEAMASLCEALTASSSPTSSSHLGGGPEDSTILDDFVISMTRGSRIPGVSINKRKDAGRRENLVPDTAKGGGVLTILADRMLKLSGGVGTRKLYAYLMEKAAKPYLSVLSTWVGKGQLEDPYFEFFVRAHGHAKPGTADVLDEYWEKRYRVHGPLVPPFFESIKDKMLLAGKYLNVLRECGRIVRVPDESDEELCDSADEDHQPANDMNIRTVARSEIVGIMKAKSILLEVDRAYRYANKALLDLLLNEQMLLDRLRSIKRYFLLDQADFLTHFLDLAETDLQGDYSRVPVEKLQSLLELVLRSPSSVSASDPFKDELRVTVLRKGTRLVEQLSKLSSTTGLTPQEMEVAQAMRGLSSRPVSSGATDRGDAESERPDSPIGGSVISGASKEPKGFETIQLDFSVPFPVSLVISRSTIVKYQLLFRHIFHIKWVERQLCRVWQMQSRHRVWRLEDSRHWIARMLALRTRMLNFVQHLSSYIALDVIEPNWRELETTIGKAATADALIKCHYSFVDSCMVGSLCTNSTLLLLTTQALSVCMNWIRFVDSYTLKVAPQTRQSAIKYVPGFLEHREKYAMHFRTKFDEAVGALYKELDRQSRSEAPILACLMIRLEPLEASRQQRETLSSAHRRISTMSAR